MSLEPCGFRVLVEVVVVEEKTECGIIMYSKQEDMTRDQFAQTIGTIVAVGSTAWKAYDRFNPVTGDELADWKPWAAVGDKVLFAKYAAKMVEDPETKKLYACLNDGDILCKL